MANDISLGRVMRRTTRILLIAEVIETTDTPSSSLRAAPAIDTEGKTLEDTLSALEETTGLLGPTLRQRAS